METQLQVVQPTTALSLVDVDIKNFELIQRKAKALSSSTMVPAQYRGAENMGNCIIALDYARRLNDMPILMVLQNLYIVHGNPTWKSSFLTACINATGKFQRLRYEFAGEPNTMNWACRAYTYEKTDTDKQEPIYGSWVSLAMAKKEGWYDKAGSKWQTMPELMLQYRASAFWQRVHAPEASLGLMTTEEIEDIQDVPYHEVTDEAELRQQVLQITPEPEQPTQQNSHDNVAQPEQQAQPQQQQGATAPF